MRVVSFMMSPNFSSKYLKTALLSWWAGNVSFMSFSECFLGAHISHTSLMMFWFNSMMFFEMSHLTEGSPAYEQGFILNFHLSSLAISLSSSEMVDIYTQFAVEVFHMVCSGIFKLGGLYHSLLSEEGVERSSTAFRFSWRDKYQMTSMLGSHLVALSWFVFFLFLNSPYISGIFDSWGVGNKHMRVVKADFVSLNPQILGKYMVSAPFGSEGWLMGMSSVEDILGGHYWLGIYLNLGGLWHLESSPSSSFISGFIWSEEVYLAYSQSAISLFGLMASMYSWYNNTAYPSLYYGPTGPEASQAQTMTFILRDTKLGLVLNKTQGPTGLGKYLMRSPSGEIILGGETMRFWSAQSTVFEPLRFPSGLDFSSFQCDLQPWQEQVSCEYMIHAPLGSINSVGGVSTEINSVNYVSPSSWLTSFHWSVGYFLLVGHWWHASSSKSKTLSQDRGLSSFYEPAFFLRPID